MRQEVILPRVTVTPLPRIRSQQPPVLFPSAQHILDLLMPDASLWALQTWFLDCSLLVCLGGASEQTSHLQTHL